MQTEYELKSKEIAEIEKAIQQDKGAEVKQHATAIPLLAVSVQQMVKRADGVQLAQALAREWRGRRVKLPLPIV